MPKKKSNKEKDAAEPLDFEASLHELEQVVRHLEEGDLGLSDSLAQYEEGIKHLKLCYDLLQQAEQRIELLAGMDAEGRPITKPFSAETTGDDEGKPRKSGRGASQPDSSGDDDIDDQGSLF